MVAPLDREILREVIEQPTMIARLRLDDGWSASSGVSPRFRPAVTGCTPMSTAVNDLPVRHLQRGHRPSLWSTDSTRTEDQ